jgi:branched-chain amino acid transport system ATP-binding protein
VEAVEGDVTVLFSATGLAKRFGDRTVLQDVSFDVVEGEVHGIMGPNGAGKTTCFHVLTGRYKPDAGTVSFRGEDITGLAPRAIARRGIARSFQVMNLFDDFSALENVMVATRALRARGFDFFRDAARLDAARERAENALADVGLAGKESVRAKSLAYGDRRALEIAVALACEPALLFLDEPTAGLGADGIARVAALIDELRGRVTLVIIEHDMRFLFGLADRISVVHWGQVIARGTPDELRANEWVRRSSLVNA